MHCAPPPQPGLQVNSPTILRALKFQKILQQSYAHQQLATITGLSSSTLARLPPAHSSRSAWHSGRTQAPPCTLHSPAEMLMCAGEHLIWVRAHSCRPSAQHSARNSDRWVLKICIFYKLSDGMLRFGRDARGSISHRDVVPDLRSPSQSPCSLFNQLPLLTFYLHNTLYR